jgi:putative peptide zinc metalloprotease protein
MGRCRFSAPRPAPIRPSSNSSGNRMASALGIESAADRALGLRMRADLTFAAQRYGRERVWAVKDPVALEYYHLRDEEHAILTMLDGRTSLEQLRRRCDELMAPRRITHAELHGYLATLHRYGLVVADALGQGEQLLLRRETAERRRRHQTLAGLLAIRFRGIHPGWILDRLYPACRWLFSTWMVVAALLLALSALGLIAVEFDTFRARLPDFQAFLAAGNLPWLLVGLAVIKLLHELGHALACRHFGSDCHELGVMLLVLTPTLYCNVTDSWMLSNKWQRMAVAAAGIYVELILASAATFLWWFSAPGIFNSLCLNTMVLCSVGTVLVNGNPLLRYDGYYLLSDFLEIPNLSAQATAAAQRLFSRWCLGIAGGRDRSLSRRRQGVLALYAVASAAYRWFVVVAVLWVLHLAARPYGLGPAVVLVGTMTLAGMVLPAATTAARWLGNPARGRRFAPLRAALSGALLMFGLVLFIWLPLPMTVEAPLVLEYQDALRVYVTVPGTLVSCARVGEAVRRGQVVARLASPAVTLEIAELTSQRDRQRLFLANLEAQRLQGVVDGAQVPAARTALADLDQRLTQLERDAARLSLVAPVDGVVLPPPNVPRESDGGGKLGTWTGTPLEERNLGAYLQTGTLVCLVGDPRKTEAVLHVPQTDIELVEPGQSARMVLDHLPGQVFQGSVTDTAKLDLKVMPRELAAAGDLPSRADSSGVVRPIDTWYQARVAIDAPPAELLARVHGRTKITVASQSLGWRLARWVKQTFSR